jgi:hypothetical protein
VLGTISGLSWAYPLIFAVGGAAAIALITPLPARVRAVLVAAALAALLVAPATWAAETLGHAASGTFPAGGPASAQSGAPGGGFAAGGGLAGAPAGGSPPQAAAASRSSASAGVASLFGQTGTAPSRGAVGGPGGFGGGGPGGFGGDSTSLGAVLRYVRAHGGGTVGVESQSEAAAAILAVNGDVAGLGGFSGRESSVSARWLAMEVRDGRLRWLLGAGSQAGGLPGDTRTGSEHAIAVAESVARKVTVDGVALYDLRGRAAAILAAAAP